MFSRSDKLLISSVSNKLNLQKNTFTKMENIFAQICDEKNTFYLNLKILHVFTFDGSQNLHT